uniref:Uncharacterized protein n=1 Tax=Methanococcus voltae (strain ATCC BAA-1334 / A3) TaxID=456320 RepID=D7DSU6_METV3
MHNVVFDLFENLFIGKLSLTEILDLNVLSVFIGLMIAL